MLRKEQVRIYASLLLLRTLIVYFAMQCICMLQIMGHYFVNGFPPMVGNIMSNDAKHCCYYKYNDSETWMLAGFVPLKKVNAVYL